MNTRREFLKMLGVVGTGTLMGEHLSYLVRQPYSEIIALPNTVNFTVSGLEPGDRVWVGSMGSELTRDETHKWGLLEELGSCVADGPTADFEIDPQEVVVRVRRAGILPYESFVNRAGAPLTEVTAVRVKDDIALIHSNR